MPTSTRHGAHDTATSPERTPTRKRAPRRTDPKGSLRPDGTIRPVTPANETVPESQISEGIPAPTESASLEQGVDDSPTGQSHLDDDEPMDEDDVDFIKDVLSQALPADSQVSAFPTLTQEAASLGVPVEPVGPRTVRHKLSYAEIYEDSHEPSSSGASTQATDITQVATDDPGPPAPSTPATPPSRSEHGPDPHQYSVPAPGARSNRSPTGNHNDNPLPFPTKSPAPALDSVCEPGMGAPECANTTGGDSANASAALGPDHGSGHSIHTVHSQDTDHSSQSWSILPAEPDDDTNVEYDSIECTPDPGHPTVDPRDIYRAVSNRALGPGGTAVPVGTLRYHLPPWWKAADDKMYRWAIGALVHSVDKALARLQLPTPARAFTVAVSRTGPLSRQKVADVSFTFPEAQVAIRTQALQLRSFEKHKSTTLDPPEAGLALSGRYLPARLVVDSCTPREAFRYAVISFQGHNVYIIEGWARYLRTGSTRAFLNEVVFLLFIPPQRRATYASPLSEDDLARVPGFIGPRNGDGFQLYFPRRPQWCWGCKARAPTYHPTIDCTNTKVPCGLCNRRGHPPFRCPERSSSDDHSGSLWPSYNLLPSAPPPPSLTDLLAGPSAPAIEARPGSVNTNPNSSPARRSFLSSVLDPASSTAAPAPPGTPGFTFGTGTLPPFPAPKSSNRASNAKPSSSRSRAAQSTHHGRSASGSNPGPASPNSVRMYQAQIQLVRSVGSPTSPHKRARTTSNNSTNGA